MYNFNNLSVIINRFFIFLLWTFLLSCIFFENNSYGSTAKRTTPDSTDKIEILDYEIKKPQIVLKGNSRKPNKKKWTWFHFNAASVTSGSKKGLIVAMVMKLLDRSDYYSGPFVFYSYDNGRTWTEPRQYDVHRWRKNDDGDTIAICDMQLDWHKPTKKMLALGGQVLYSKKGEFVRNKLGSGKVAYTVYDPDNDEWTSLKTLEIPENVHFFLRHYMISSCSQWHTKEDGTLLLPVYGLDEKGISYFTHGIAPSGYFSTVLHCDFNGNNLKYIRHGSMITHDVPRGMCEPSLAFYKGRYYLTIRNDLKGYVAVSKDGLTYQPIRPWCFDDGTELGNYCTQQHWLVHSNGLFLVYTRRAKNNSHVMRHRAPLFISQVDLDSLRVIRKSERIAMPLRGKSAFGNFGAVSISSEESWITVAEKISFDKQNNAYIVRVRWTESNTIFDY